MRWVVGADARRGGAWFQAAFYVYKVQQLLQLAVRLCEGRGKGGAEGR